MKIYNTAKFQIALNKLKVIILLLSIQTIESILGQANDNKFITSTLKSLSIESEIKKDTIKFKQPSWRYDLERPIDLIEGAKHYGFNNFKSTLPIGNNLNQVGNYWNVRKYFIDKLSLEKFNETQSLSFTQKEYNEFFDPDKEGVKVLNPESNARVFKNKFILFVNQNIQI